MESLYTKYRPQTFEQVVGQKHVVETLMRAVAEHKTSHAYLFCGPRGTGKTTMARLLAKALMCEKGEGEMPDGMCEQCRLIAAGEHPDVAELDAASRTGVDNVRDEIISRVNYAPSMGRYKVYIIDEVHMLTTAAFNALLKTLEEPPEHVVFVMCTTDPQKVLPTILSRVQRFDFHSIAPDEMQAHLAYVCGREGFTFDDAALELVVRHARGGMRDALTSLEQLSVFGNGHIGVKAAQDFLGEVSGSVLGTVSKALADRDVPTLFSEVEKLVGSGRDLLQFTRELASHVRDVYVCSVAPGSPAVVSATGEALEALRAEASAFGSADRVARALTILGDASSEMRTATNQRLVLEIAFTRIARPESDLTVEALADRLAVLEQKLASGQFAAAAPAQAPAASVPAPAPAAPAARTQAPAPAARSAAPAVQPTAGQGTYGVPQAAPAAQPAPMARSQQPAPHPARATMNAPQAPAMAPAALQRAWRQVVDGLVKTAPAKGSLLLSADAVSDDGSNLVVSLPHGSGFALKMLERSDVRAVVEPAVNAVFGARTVTFADAADLGLATRQPAQAAAPSARPAAPAPRPAAPAAPPAPRVPQQPPAQVQAHAPGFSAPRSAAPAAQPPAGYARQPQAPEPEYVPDSAYGAAAEPAGDYPMPWDDQPVSGPAPGTEPAAPQSVAASRQPAAEGNAPADLAPAPDEAPQNSVPADLAPEFSQVLEGLTAVFGAPTNVSVEAANQGGAAEDGGDLTYDDEGAGGPDDNGFADEPIDDADGDE